MKKSRLFWELKKKIKTSKFKLQPNQITLWKKEFFNNAGAAFEKESKIDDSDKEKDKLYDEIGRLEV